MQSRLSACVHFEADTYCIGGPNIEFDVHSQMVKLKNELVACDGRIEHRHDLASSEIDLFCLKSTARFDVFNDSGKKGISLRERVKE